MKIILCCLNCNEDMDIIESGIQDNDKTNFWIHYCKFCGTVGIRYSDTNDIKWFTCLTD